MGRITIIENITHPYTNLYTNLRPKSYATLQNNKEANIITI